MIRASSDGRRSVSPSFSRGSSPAGRTARWAIEDGLFKNDKGLRRHAATIDRALSTWETSPEDWADYIAFLSRLLKAIQTVPRDVPSLPRSTSIASKLAQCLNPSLPSGVHQKALEVYTYIFSTFGEAHISTRLDQYLPGLAPVLSFASLSVRPALYSLLEDHVVGLPPSSLRPALKSFILSLLPALEDETSEDFERSFALVESFQRAFTATEEDRIETTDRGGYFWQCMFLAVITSPTRRQGALNYLVHRLPLFKGSSKLPSENGLSETAEAALFPESGLLTRCFASGLSDANMLIQRGFLDLLVTNLPLNSPVLQERVSEQDLHRLIAAALSVLLRREMSLNRRLWVWLLGPEPSDADKESAKHRRDDSASFDGSPQLQYFLHNGRQPMERCLLTMFSEQSSASTDVARPFRICLSLMDRWEIGGTLVPLIFLPAMRHAFFCSRQAPAPEAAEFVKSAALFFDGVESQLIWTNLFELVQKAAASEGSSTELSIFTWIVQEFNVREEEMVTRHIPLVTLYLMCIIRSWWSSGLADKGRHLLETSSLLLDLIPARAYTNAGKTTSDQASIDVRSTKDVCSAIEQFYSGSQSAQQPESTKPFSRREIGELLLSDATDILVLTLDQERDADIPMSVTPLLHLIPKLPDPVGIPSKALIGHIDAYLRLDRNDIVSFPVINSSMSVLSCLNTVSPGVAVEVQESLTKLEPVISSLLWRYLSPTEPKYHVEACRLIWQLDELLGAHDAVKASIIELMGWPTDGSSTSDQSAVRNIQTFANIWAHTVPSQATGSKSDPRRPSRRVSGTTTSLDSAPGSRRRDVLTGPLLITLDALSDQSEIVSRIAKTWLIGQSGNDLIFQILLGRMQILLDKFQTIQHPDNKMRLRKKRDIGQKLEYVLHHVQAILASASTAVWESFGLMSSSESGDKPQPLATWLTYNCVNLLRHHAELPLLLNRRLLSLLDRLLASPAVVRTHIASSSLGGAMLDLLSTVIGTTNQSLQVPLLKIAITAISLDVRHREYGVAEKSGKYPQNPLTRPANAGPRQESQSQVEQQSSVPVSKIVDVIHAGISTDSCQQYLDFWLDFMGDVLPLLGTGILENLLQLTETLCRRTNTIFDELIKIIQADSHHGAFSPDATIIKLLDCLNLLLSSAHHTLLTDGLTDAPTRGAEQTQTVLSAITSSVQKVQGPSSKTAKANSRLTVILAMKDAVRLCLRIWIWASYGLETSEHDRASGATAASTALKLRNKTRHMLEQMFSVEPLESLEEQINLWSQTEGQVEQEVVLSLLHIMSATPPKHTLPAILDALCSRTNPAALISSRQSSLTSELSAADIVLFFSAYLESVDDDAMDEIWTECTSFLRDVLSNPLPYRQVLPALLWVVLLLSTKLENTNYGEQRRMRRELGDSFLRLLTATFTALPAGTFQDGLMSSELDSVVKETEVGRGKRDMNLVVILRELVGQVELIMETPERIASAINAVSTNIISPAFHARAFPNTVNADLLSLLSKMTKKAPVAKSWRKDVSDAFNDARFLASPPRLVEDYWFPVLQQWSLSDKERMGELLSRLTPPSSAGIMFGVGASAARLEADRRTQSTLRRVALLLLCASADSHAAHLPLIAERLVELFQATTPTSPSSAVKPELFMLFRALLMSTSTMYFAPLWPVLNENLQAALLSTCSSSTSDNTFSNFALLQASKLLDLLVAIAPDEFQLHEWIYITDTTDAIYHPPEWQPSALSDQIAEHLGSGSTEDETRPLASVTIAGERRPVLTTDLSMDMGDIKAMTREDFARAVLRPFLSQLSLHAYESTYSMENPRIELFRENLLADLLDVTTIVE